MLRFIRWIAWLFLPVVLREGGLSSVVPALGPLDGLEIVLPAGGAWREQPNSPRKERHAQFIRIRVEGVRTRSEVIVLPDLGQSMAVAWCDGEYYAFIQALTPGAEDGIRRVDLDGGTSEALALPSGCAHLRSRSLCSDGQFMYAHNGKSLWRLWPGDQPASLGGEVVYTVSPGAPGQGPSGSWLADSIYPPAVTDEHAYVMARDGIVREVRLSDGTITREIAEFPHTSVELITLPTGLLIADGSSLFLRREVSVVSWDTDNADPDSLASRCERSRRFLGRSGRLLHGAGDIFTVESGDKDDYTTVRSLWHPSFRVHIDGVDCRGPGVARQTRRLQE